MATGHDARRTMGRIAALAAGVLMLGSVWGGVASAAGPTTSTPPPAANAAAPGPGSAECQTLTAQLAQATSALQTAGGLDPTGTLTRAVTTLTTQVATACTALPAPTTSTTTSSTTTTSAGVTTGTADRDCPSFVSQQQAQAYFTAIGGSVARNADLLDRDRDGLACEDTPYADVASAYPAGTFGQVSTVPSGGIETGDGSTAP